MIRTRRGAECPGQRWVFILSEEKNPTVLSFVGCGCRLQPTGKRRMWYRHLGGSDAHCLPTLAGAHIAPHYQCVRLKLMSVRSQATPELTSPIVILGACVLGCFPKYAFAFADCPSRLHRTQARKALAKRSSRADSRSCRKPASTIPPSTRMSSPLSVSISAICPWTKTKPFK